MGRLSLDDKKDSCRLSEPTFQRPVLPYPAPPLRCAPPRPKPPVKRPRLALDNWIRQVNFMQGMSGKNNLQRQLGDSPLVRNQDRRASVIPRINRRCQTLVFFLHLFSGHALYEKCLQRKANVGPLVSSQKKEKTDIPLINHRSNAHCVL